MNIEELFEKYEDEFLNYRVDPSLEKIRKDFTIFKMLNDKFPSHKDLISGSGHEEIFLDVDPKELLSVFTEEEIVKMIRCGLRFSSEYDCLCMYV